MALNILPTPTGVERVENTEQLLLTESFLPENYPLSTCFPFYMRDRSCIKVY